jgi:hypothetical protein
MCMAAGNDDFVVQFGQQTHDGYARYVEQQRLQHAIDNLATLAAMSESPSPSSAGPSPAAS